MSRKWEHDGDDLRELPNGSVRVAYDADDQEYIWKRPDGATLRGPEYGPLRLYRLPNGDLAGVEWMFNRPIVPCPCCDKDLRESDKAPCDCGADKCPLNVPRCIKHCHTGTHSHRGMFGNNIPDDQPVVHTTFETLLEAMYREGRLPKEVVEMRVLEKYFEPSRLSVLWRSFKGLFKRKK